MHRTLVAAAAGILVLAGCGSQEAAPPAQGAAPPNQAETLAAAQTADAAAPGLDPADGVPYRCGDEVFRLSLEANRLYVVMPDGTVETIRDLGIGGGPEMATNYTNGRMTFLLAEGSGDARVSFARGRTAPVTCTPVE